MFKNLARTLGNIALARASIAPANLATPATQLSAKELAFTGRGKSGKVSHKKGNAAQLKRAAKKASNIRKFNS